MALLAGCSGSQSGTPVSGDTLDTKDELVVGMSLDFPPFETIDADGNPTGIGVDMANDLGKALGKKIRIENMSPSALIPALQTKKVDLIIASMTILLFQPGLHGDYSQYPPAGPNTGVLLHI